MTVFRNAQGYSLSSQPVAIAAGAIGTVVGTAQVSLALEELVVSGGVSDGGLITGIRVAGQEILASNAAVPWMALSNRIAGMDGGYRSIGLTISNSQTVAVDVSNTGVAAGNFQFSCTTTPIPDSAVVPVNSSGDSLNFLFGLGETLALAAGASANLTAVALRPTVLGRLVVVQQGAVNPGGALADITIDSILVNNIELLSGQTGAAVGGGGIPAECCGVLSTYDGDTSLLQYPVELNSTVTVLVTNRTAGPVSIGAAIYCLPR